MRIAGNGNTAVDLDEQVSTGAEDDLHCLRRRSICGGRFAPLKFAWLRSGFSFSCPRLLV